jgi:hypothetical protein
MLAPFDDALIMAPDISTLQPHVRQVPSQMKKLKGKHNPAKFNLLVYKIDGQVLKCSKSSMTTDRHHFGCALKHDCIKLLGGINVCTEQNGMELSCATTARIRCRLSRGLLLRSPCYPSY